MKQPGGGAHITNQNDGAEQIIRVMFAHGASDSEIAAKLNRSVWAVQRRRHRMGLLRDTLAPVPADFADRAPHMSLYQLRTSYKVGHNTIKAWMLRADISYTKGQNSALKLVPDDFHTHAKVEGSTALEKRYKVSSKIISRWRKETGIPCPPRPKKGAQPKRQMLKPIKRGTIAFPIQPNTPGPDGSMAGMAAQHLRRWFPRVFKARTIDPKAPEDIWIVGALKLTTDELLRKAEAKGWKVAI